MAAPPSSSSRGGSVLVSSSTKNNKPRRITHLPQTRHHHHRFGRYYYDGGDDLVVRGRRRAVLLLPPSRASTRGGGFIETGRQWIQRQKNGEEEEEEYEQQQQEKKDVVDDDEMEMDMDMEMISKNGDNDDEGKNGDNNTTNNSAAAAAATRIAGPPQPPRQPSFEEVYLRRMRRQRFMRSVVPVLTLGVLLALWYASNILFNIVNKQVLTQFPHAATITAIHVSVASIICSTAWAVRAFPYPKGAMRCPALLRIIAPLSFLHACGFLATNASLGSVQVSFTHTIKALEPFFAVVLSAVLASKRPPNVASVLALIPIVAGVVIASVTEVSFAWRGFLFAMLSNVCFQSRNVLSKEFMARESYDSFEGVPNYDYNGGGGGGGQQQSSSPPSSSEGMEESSRKKSSSSSKPSSSSAEMSAYDSFEGIDSSSTTKPPPQQPQAVGTKLQENKKRSIPLTDVQVDEFALFALISMGASIVMLPLAVVIDGTDPFVSMIASLPAHPRDAYFGNPSEASYALMRSIVAGVWRTCDVLVSYSILSRVTPVTHSVANCVKRVAVIVASMLFFQNPTSLTNRLGTGLALFGVMLYSLALSSSKARTSRSTRKS